ncbi:lysylphosphatidylglycerol synthase domain-containing protein [Natrinema soli]|uniref:Lysylphosphatidylglycerol synthase domain-containing protein n=1 Tax=Natrinema soli TaxID=1930624 RepID=A0ABD5SJR5_9EURY|nr:lysylphosphatidylglycerol synthase domain-containing protein [Natrinema soli]
MTILLESPNATAAVLTFGVVMVAGITLSYAIGYLGLSWEDTAYPMPEPTSNPPEEPTDASRADVEDLKWTIREGIGVVIVSLFGLGAITNVLPLPSGLGSVESVFILLLVSTAGMPAPEAPAATFLYQAATYWFPLLFRVGTVTVLQPIWMQTNTQKAR